MARYLTEIQQKILSKLVERGPMPSTELRKACSVRFIGVNTINYLRNKDCITTTGDLSLVITEVGRTAEKTGVCP